MKKFLSVMLAVMMVLSTVSFAAPSAVGTLDTVTESEVDFSDLVFEDAAELAATAGDESTYGKLILNVDFENFEVGEVLADYTWFENILDADDYDPEFVNQSFRPNWEVGANTIAELNGNKYIRGGQGWSQIRMENQKYGIGEGQSPEGVYTFALDAIDFGDTARKVSATTQSSWVGGVQVTAPVTPTTLVSWSGKLGEWERVAAAWNGSSNNMSWFFTDGATTEVGFDNIKVYYRPATVTLTIAGEEYEVSTDAPVTVASLASEVTAPTGYILSGLSLTEGGELISDQYFFEDATLYPVFEKDPYMSDVYGKALFVIDFENEAAQSWHGHGSADNSNYTYGAQIWEVASYYDARFTAAPNYRIRFFINETTHYDQETVVDASGNHYTAGTSYTQYPQIGLSNWNSVPGEAGIYTFVVDTMVDTAPTGFGTNAGAGWVLKDSFDGKLNEWDRIVVQKEMAEAGNLPDASNVVYYSSLDASAKGVAQVAWDNATLYYKPYTADVTLVVNGEEYVAEDISTAGVSADTIVAAAGVEIPYGKKAVLSATQGGESVGNVITLAGDAKYYVSFVADDSISEYGKRLFLIDFENMTAGTSITDFLTVDKYTDNFNADWAHLSFNWEVGANAIVEEDGNKFIKGQQGWAQVRIGNANFESAPAGYYTMALKTKNYGTEDKTISSKDQNSGVSATWVKAGSVTGTINPYPVVNGEWNEVASELSAPGKDFTIYYTAQMTTDVAFDDIALYYRPASVNLTVVDTDGNETVYENCDSVVNVDDLLADVNAPFGYKAALSTEKNGEPITGTLNLVADAKLYVVLTEDETVHFEYGKALYIIDFERESMQGWNGNSQEIDNSVKANGAYVSESASYYDPMFEGKNYRVRFVINENDDWLFDQKTVADANGNHYNTGTIKTQWPQVYQTNYGSLTGEAGYYTFMVDTKTSAAPASGYGFGAWTKPEGFSVPVDEWFTIVGTQELTADGKLPSGVWFNYSFGADQVGNVTVSFDNARLYYKPYTASIDVVANGEVVKTVESVDTTAGILASELVAGVKVKGFEITGVKLGTVAYGLDETVVPSCDCSVDLVLVERTADPATPETAAEKSIRISDPTGIRFKAGISKAEIASVTDYGWVVVRQKHLNDAGITAASVTVDGNEIKKVVGYGRQNNEDLKSFFEQDAEFNFFTAVLYFSATEDDGYPTAEKLAEKFVAVPFAKVDGEFIYGDATAPTSLYDVALALWESDEWNSLDEADQTYLDNLMIKVDDAGLGA